MKFRIIYFSFLLLFTFALFLNYRTGPANFAQEDRTGGPFSDAPCQFCHTAGAFSPNLSVEILDGENAVTAYEPGKTYTLKAVISADAAAAVFGFQTVVLKDSDNTNAGSFGDAPEGMSVIELEGRQYAEHNIPNTENTFEIEWTAPESGTGEVNIYAACVAGNNNTSNSGDGSVFLVDPVMLTELVTNAEEQKLVFTDLRLLNNPVFDVLSFKIWTTENELYQINISNISGQVIISKQLQLSDGENNGTVDLSNLPTGTYIFQITNGKAVIARKLLKM